MKNIVPALVIVLIIVLGGTLRSVWRSSHVETHRLDSPSGDYRAIHYLGNERMTPPYGQFVEVVNTWNPLGLYAADVVFSGYCEGRAGLQWLSDHELAIYCVNAESVSVQPGKIKIEVRNYQRIKPDEP